MRNYADLQYAFQQLELAALYQRAGKLDEFIAATGCMLWGMKISFIQTGMSCWTQSRILRISGKTRTHSPAGCTFRTL